MSYKTGLASQERMEKVKEKKNGVEKIIKTLNEISLEPEDINVFLASRNSSPLLQKQKTTQILLRPNIDLISLSQLNDKLKSELASFNKETIEQAEIQIKYETYIEKEKEIVQKMSQMEELSIPDNFDYKKIQAISNEAREKLHKIKPRTLGQASRISGINPSDVQILMVYMGR
jgi:tRNA uridine 5-carboxymethylaminomethyl modification enzyme